MKLDLWRALGVTAAVLLFSIVGNLFVYSTDLAIETADLVAALVGALILGACAIAYFKEGGVPASAGNGLMLGGFITLYFVVFGFVVGMLSSVMGEPMPEVTASTLSIVLSFVLTFATPAAVGWYMGKR